MILILIGIGIGIIGMLVSVSVSVSAVVCCGYRYQWGMVSALAQIILGIKHQASSPPLYPIPPPLVWYFYNMILSAVGGWCIDTIYLLSGMGDSIG